MSARTAERSAPHQSDNERWAGLSLVPFVTLTTLLACSLWLLAASWGRGFADSIVDWWTRRKPRRTAKGASQRWRAPLPVAIRTDEPEEIIGIEAVGYVTTEQAETDADTDFELLRQITMMDAECAKRSWRLAEVVCDVGPLADVLSRPGLTHALELLEDGRAPCLMVAELRRLGRLPAELGRVVRCMRERGIRLVAVDVALDTEAGTTRPRRARRPGRPAVDDLPAVKAYIVAMRSAGMTLQAIADRLNEEGVPTVRGGREWRPSSVQVAAGYRRPRRLSGSGPARPDRVRRGRG